MISVQPTETAAEIRLPALLAGGLLRSGEVVRRGDLPAGGARLELDTIQIEREGLYYEYAPPQHEVPLSVTASLDLSPSTRRTS
jgi:hypothetical protein